MNQPHMQGNISSVKPLSIILTSEHLCKHPFISPSECFMGQAFKQSLSLSPTPLNTHGLFIQRDAQGSLFCITEFEIPPFQTVQGSNEPWKMGQSHWKPWHWTEWKRKHKGPIGWILWMGAPYTCKWYTLSGHPGTSSHSCRCWAVAEWISQRKEGLRIAYGEGGGRLEALQKEVVGWKGTLLRARIG